MTWKLQNNGEVLMKVNGFHGILGIVQAGPSASERRCSKEIATAGDMNPTIFTDTRAA